MLLISVSAFSQNYEYGVSKIVDKYEGTTRYLFRTKGKGYNGNLFVLIKQIKGADTTYYCQLNSKNFENLNDNMQGDEIDLLSTTNEKFKFKAGINVETSDISVLFRYEAAFVITKDDLQRFSNNIISEYRIRGIYTEFKNGEKMSTILKYLITL